MHVAELPEHAPDQPVNADPLVAVAVNVTDVPLAKSAAQVEPQSIPDGEELTEPDPEPASVVVNV